jgi:hypothetical protein
MADKLGRRISSTEQESQGRHTLRSEPAEALRTLESSPMCMQGRPMCMQDAVQHWTTCLSENTAKVYKPSLEYSISCCFVLRYRPSQDLNRQLRHHTQCLHKQELDQELDSMQSIEKVGMEHLHSCTTLCTIKPIHLQAMLPSALSIAGVPR